MVCLLVTCVTEQRESVKKTIHVKNKKIQTDDNSVWWNVHRKSVNMNPNRSLDSNLLQFLCSLFSLLLHIQYIMKFKDWTLSESVTRGLCHIVPDMMRKHWRGSCGEAVMDEQPDGTWARGNTSPTSEAGGGEQCWVAENTAALQLLLAHLLIYGAATTLICLGSAPLITSWATARVYWTLLVSTWTNWGHAQGEDVENKRTSLQRRSEDSCCSIYEDIKIKTVTLYDSDLKYNCCSAHLW